MSAMKVKVIVDSKAGIVGEFGMGDVFQLGDYRKRCFKDSLSKRFRICTAKLVANNKIGTRKKNCLQLLPWRYYY